MFFITKKYDPETNTIEVSFNGKLPEKYAAHFSNFYKFYEIDDMVIDEKDGRRKLKRKQDRTCRFCGKSHPDVTFKKTAHLVPAFIGNRYLLSDFECDACNEQFGKYESDFANFLGITRSFNPRRKGSVVQFKTPDGKLIVEEGTMEGTDAKKGTVIKSLDPDEKHFTFEKEGKKLVLHSTKHPYTPIKVYKSILKMALSVLPEEYLTRYPLAFEMLRTVEDRVPSNNLFRCVSYTCPGMPFPSPLILLFKKKDPTLSIPTHLINVYFLNYIYQVAIPFCEDDKWMYDGKTQVAFHTAPPMIDERWANAFGFPSQQVLDLSSSSVIKNEKHNTVFTFDSAKFFGDPDDVR